MWLLECSKNVAFAYLWFKVSITLLLAEQSIIFHVICILKYTRKGKQACAGEIIQIKSCYIHQAYGNICKQQKKHSFEGTLIYINVQLYML